MRDAPHKWQVPFERDEALLSSEARIRRTFIGATALNALLVLLIIMALLRWGGLPPLMLVVYTSLLLWALVVIAYVFVLLLRLLRKVEGELGEQAFTDGLTGAFNFRYLEHRIQEEQARIARHGGSVAVLFIDLHGLKEANDRYGHPAGDALLREVALGLKGRTRSEDIVARIGGDEFIVLVPEAGCDQAKALAGRLCGTIEDYRSSQSATGPVEFLSVSIGVAAFPGNGKTLTAVVAAADRAMYKAKELGGNRICVSEEVATQESPAGGKGSPQTTSPAAGSSKEA